MKTRGLLIGLGLSALLFQFNAVLAAAAQEKKGAESITIDSSQGNIAFPHGRHQEIFVDCQPCHKLFPKTSHVIRKMIGEGTLKKNEVMDMCKKCHQVRLGEGKTAGPTTCKACHVK